MHAELLVLRLIHIAGAIFWVGTAAFTSFFLAPALTEAGPAAQPIMAGIRKRHFLALMPAISALTLITGGRLMWIASSGLSSTYLSSRSGLAFATSGAAATVAFLLGVLVARPAALRMGALAGQLPEATEAQKAVITGDLARWRRLSARIGNAILLLLILATAGMAVARYL